MDTENVKKLIQEGISIREISRRIGVHHSTILYWKRKNFEIRKKSFSYKNIDKKSYSYILGLYLGDGYINKTERTFRIRFSLDTKYQNVVECCKNELTKLFPNNKINEILQKKTTTVVYVYSNLIPDMFPQIGKGKKHNRKIKLEKWQTDILDPIFFLKGLFHSDGSYYYSTKNDSWYYNFRNYSIDIINLYCKYCDVLDISYTKSKNTVNHYKKDTVLELNNIFGIKTARSSAG
jgi:hypothetical protein